MNHMGNAINSFFSKLGLHQADPNVVQSQLQTYMTGAYTLIVRWILPLLAISIFIRCVLPLLRSSGEHKPWGYLKTPDDALIPLKHWENSIGRSKLSDILFNLPFISRSHAVLSYSDGDWFISDLNAKGGVKVNGDKITGRTFIQYGDLISLSGLTLTFLGPDAKTASPDLGRSSRIRSDFNAGFTLMLIVLFQILGCVQEMFYSAKAVHYGLPVVFLIFILMELFHCLTLYKRGMHFELEMLTYFLCGIGLLVTASASPSSLFKELFAIMIGVALYCAFLLIISDLDRADKLKRILYFAAFFLMALNVVIGQTRHGAKNWINLGFMTFQPMEFVKIAFVLAGTATLDRLLTTRSLTAYIVFSGACIGTLAITKDFGTALIFFCAFLIMAFMRSGDIRTIALITAGAVLGAFAVISFFPYVSARFSAWGHVWQHADSTGYQQTRTMIGIASGGLLGVGGGKGYLSKIVAADTDLAFGVICEELGLIIAAIAVLCIIVYALFSLSSVRKCRSSFYAIAACGASTIFLMQTALNMFGSVDILPLTGVTMPFISNGGSSMLTCWCLLAFIKSADERFNLAQLTANADEDEADADADEEEDETI